MIMITGNNSINKGPAFRKNLHNFCEIPFPMIFDVWLTSIAQKYANLWRNMKELLLQSFGHFSYFSSVI